MPGPHSERQFNSDGVGVGAGWQPRYACRAAIDVYRLGGARTRRQGNRAVNGQQIAVTCIGVQVIGHEMTRAVRQRARTAARGAVMTACANLDHRRGTRGAKNRHRTPTAAKHLRVSLTKEAIGRAEIQGTERCAITGGSAVDLTTAGQNQRGGDLTGNRGRGVGPGHQGKAQRRYYESRSNVLHDPHPLWSYQSSVTVSVSL